MPKFYSLSYPQRHPFQDRLIGKEPIELQEDEWLKVQVEAEILVKVPDEKVKAK